MSDFYSKLRDTLNSGKSNSVFLSGNIYDLFRHEDEYISLVDYIVEKTRVDGIRHIVYELNGPIRMEPHIRHRIKQIWEASYIGKGCKETFEDKLLDAVGRPAVALELLRQITMACRDKAKTKEKLLIIIEAADMMIPAGSNFSSLNAADRRCVCIAKDWFSDPNFVMGRDSVIMLAESISEIHPNVARLPQIIQIEVPSPDLESRMAYIDSVLSNRTDEFRAVDQETGKIVSKRSKDLAQKTAGLTLQAVRQILCDKSTNDDEVFAQVERFIKSQVGEDTIEFKKPHHSLDDVMGNSRLKEFIANELIPRFRSTGSDALTGAAVGGPIGSGKSFIFEAVAAEIGCPVIVLKNLRSQYFGQTDVVFERLRRVLESIGKVLIFVDEADTQFGRVSGDVHATEKRLTGKIQAMMSDPKLKGQVIWLLMTARIHLLSPDIRRPGRVGDLIIPVLDPEGEDRNKFAGWCLSEVIEDGPDKDVWIRAINEWAPTKGYSAAAWAGLKSTIAAKKATTIDEIKSIVWNMIPPNIAEEREYQTLQALVNCTRKSLLPLSVGTRDHSGNITFSMHDLHICWRRKIAELEEKGYG